MIVAQAFYGNWNNDYEVVTKNQPSVTVTSAKSTFVNKNNLMSCLPDKLTT